jgi:hypothetical protein
LRPNNDGFRHDRFLFGDVAAAAQFQTSVRNRQKSSGAALREISLLAERRPALARFLFGNKRGEDA